MDCGEMEGAIEESSDEGSSCHVDRLPTRPLLKGMATPAE